VTATHQLAAPVDTVTAAAMAGAEGNERLTAWTGAALLLGFGAEGLTILDVRWYLEWHILIGYALLVPVALKASSTLYRFGRYYTNAPAYRLKGPPWLPLRVLGPFMLLLTAAVLLSGVALMFVSGYHHRLEELHRLSFIAWFGVTTIHVLAYLWRLPRLMVADLIGRGTARSAALTRILLSVGSGVVGLALGGLLLPWIRSYLAG
jgi:hypothetical protein